MASFYSDALLYKQPLRAHSTSFSLTSRPKIRLRRTGRRLPIVQLGASKKPRRGFFLARLFRRVRLRSFRLQFILKRLKQFYRSLIKDIMEARASVEAYQQRVFMEASLALPSMGVSFSNCHGGATLISPRRIFM